MANRLTVYKRFNKALIAFLAADANLVSFSGHTGGSPKIFIRQSKDQAALPCIGVVVSHLGPVLSDVDEGVKESLVQVFCWSSNKYATMDALGAVESLCMQDANSNSDASFSADGITTVGMIPLAPVSVGDEVADEVGVFVSTAAVLIRWIDTAV